MKTKFDILKLTLVFLLFMFYSGSTKAQQESQAAETVKVPSLFLGGGLGINDYGFGMCMEVPVVKKLSFYGNAGVGGWGWKIGAGISFYPSSVPYKSSISLGYSHASGIKDFETELEVNPNNVSEKVKLDLNPVGTINLMYSYNFHMGKRSKFVFSAGYAIPVTNNNNSYELKSIGVTLSERSKQVIEMMRPGGLILGGKFLFGID